MYKIARPSRRSSCTDLNSGRTSCFHPKTRSNRKEAPSASCVASHFSIRAARGSYSDKLFDAKDQLSECDLNAEKTASYSHLDRSWSTDEDRESINNDENRWRFAAFLPRISLAKLSIIFLALATACDIAVTQMTADSPRPKTSLGSAAISSVTDTLSPILPFAGGLDLRRDDYWTSSEDGNWWGTLQSVVIQVQDAFAQQPETPSKSTETESSSTANQNTSDAPRKSSRRKRSNKNYVAAISAPGPFVSLDAIAQLTLGEVTETFRYAVESNQVDFNEQKFMSGVQPRVGTIIQAMKDAVAQSRGRDAKEWKRTTATKAESPTSGEFDALKFCAAMRVFAEWRLLRQVPAEGFKGFAVGMSLGHKDVVQNLVKIEQSVHDYLTYQQDLRAECATKDSCPSDIYAPTFRELLTFEIETGIQNSEKLPRLKEISAGMGALWVRRQLMYQTQLFDNIVNHKDFSSSKVAIAAAYTEVYDKFHGWAVQKIFNYSYKSVPEAEVIFRHMNPHRLEEVLKEASLLLSSSSNGSGESNSSSKKEKDENPIERFVNHIGSEWDKFASNFAKVVLKRNQPSNKVDVRGGGGRSDPRNSKNKNESSDQHLDEYVTREMVKDAHQQIAAYLLVARPLLDDVAVLFEDLNMNDPTRV